MTRKPRFRLQKRSTEKKVSLTFSGPETLFSFSMPDRDAYIADPSLMPVHWNGLWEPSERMLDWDGKVASLMCTDKDHLFTVAHRGDFLYYPENSIESMISVWKTLPWRQSSRSLSSTLPASETCGSPPQETSASCSSAC